MDSTRRDLVQSHQSQGKMSANTNVKYKWHLITFGAKADGESYCAGTCKLGAIGFIDTAGVHPEVL